MDKVLKDDVARAMKNAENCRDRLAASGEKLKTHFNKMRRDFEKHLNLMEKQTSRKLEELVKHQTEKIERAEIEIKDRLAAPDAEPDKLKSALKRLSNSSDTFLDFEVSPDLDRLRFLSEFGILRVKQSRISYTDKSDENDQLIKERQLSALEPCQSSSDICLLYKLTRRTPEDNGSVDKELTTDSGFVHVSSQCDRNSVSVKSSHYKENYECMKIEDSGNAPNRKEERTYIEKAEPEMTSESENFLTMTDGKSVAFSKEGGYIKLISKEHSLLSRLQVKYPKAICCLKKDSVLVAVETPSHDKLVVVKVAGNELMKVNTFRIKCHDRICDISYKSSCLYVMCSGNHLHIMDT